MIKIIEFLFVILCATVAFPAYSAVIEKEVLDNGLEVYFMEDHRASVVVNMLWFNVGGSSDPSGMSGMAHYLEHMMFAGTKRHTDFSHSLTYEGATFNAGTDSDYTVYYEIFPKEKMEKVMSIEADRAVNILFTKENSNKERSIVAEERRMRVDNVPSALLDEEMQSIFHKNGYGRPVVGWENEIKMLNLNDATLFYKKYYSMGNATLFVYGDSDFKTVMEAVKNTYGKIPSGIIKHRRDVTYPDEPMRRYNNRIIIDNNPLVENTVVNLLYDAPNFKHKSTSGELPLEMALHMFAEGKGSYLYKKMVLDRKIAVSVSSYYSYYSLGPGKIAFTLVPAEGTDYNELIREFDQFLIDFTDSNISEEKLKSVAFNSYANESYSVDSMLSAAFNYGFQLFMKRSVEFPEERYQRAKEVSVGDVKESFKQVFNHKGRVEGILVPMLDRVSGGNG